MPTTPGGLPQLDKALAVLQQLNGVLAGAPAMIALGVAIVDMIRSSGRSDEEAAAEVAKFEATVTEALGFNKDWLATHPRIEG